MNDLISRQSTIHSIRECAEAARDNHEYDMEQGYLNAIECVEEEPSAQPERLKGHWIVWGGMDIPENHGRHICSLCGEFAPVRYEKPLIKEYLSDFCPNCGADMRGDE